MKREVAAELEVEIIAPTTLEFQIAVAPHPNAEVSERLSFAYWMEIWSRRTRSAACTATESISWTYRWAA